MSSGGPILNTQEILVARPECGGGHGETLEVLYRPVRLGRYLVRQRHRIAPDALHAAREAHPAADQGDRQDHQAPERREKHQEERERWTAHEQMLPSFREELVQIAFVLEEEVELDEVIHRERRQPRMVVGRHGRRG